MRVITAVFATLLATACAVAQQEGPVETGPFTGRDARLMSAVWPEIREAAAFEEIDWDSVGLDEAPGSFEAQRVVRDNWNAIRRAARFEDIDWQASTDFRQSSQSAFSPEELSRTGPFTRREAELMSAVWPEIREAATFEDIDWESVGLDAAPGDTGARSFMASHWGELRRAPSFADINWEATARN